MQHFELFTTVYVYMGLSLSVSLASFSLALAMCQRYSLLCTITKYVSAIVSALFLTNFFLVLLSPKENIPPIPTEAVYLVSLSFLLGVTVFKYMHREYYLLKENLANESSNKSSPPQSTSS